MVVGRVLETQVLGKNGLCFCLEFGGQTKMREIMLLISLLIGKLPNITPKEIHLIFRQKRYSAKASQYRTGIGNQL